MKKTSDICIPIANCIVVNFWNEIYVQLSQTLALTTSHKLIVYTALWGEILELKSYLAEAGPHPRPLHKSNALHCPLW